MRQRILSFIVFFVLGCCILHPWDEQDIHTRYCTRGQKGYQDLFKKVGSIYSEMERFWKSFRKMIINFDRDGDFKKILQCTEFWKEFQQDRFWDLASDKIKKERILVVERFQQAIGKYWAGISNKMSRLEEVTDTPADVKKLTQEKAYETKLRNYQHFYNQLRTMPIPDNWNRAENLKTLFSKLVNTVGRDKVQEQRISAVKAYLDAWKKYYDIPTGSGKFDLEAKAFKKKSLKLEEIEGLAGTIDLFGIAGHPYHIREKKEKVDETAEYYTIHHGLDTWINTFYRKKHCTWQQLMDARKEVLGKAERLSTLEPLLKDKVAKFLEIPQKASLNSLETYFVSHHNSNDMIARFINEVYQKQLLGTIKKQWQEGLAGGNTLKRFKENIDKYNQYFGTTRYEERADFLCTYNQLKKEQKIPELYRYVKKYSFHQDDFEHMKKNWNIKSIKELEGLYTQDVRSTARMIFTTKTKDGQRRGKGDFEWFRAFYNEAREDIPDLTLGDPLHSVYSKLEDFYTGNESKKKRAAIYIQSYHKELEDIYDMAEVKSSLTNAKPGKTPANNQDPETGEVKVIPIKGSKDTVTPLTNGQNRNNASFNSSVNKAHRNFNELKQHHQKANKKTNSYRLMAESKLDDMTKDEWFKQLSAHQQAKMHYMASELYISVGGSFIPACHHLYECYKIMNEHSLDNLALHAEGETFEISTVMDKLKKYFNELSDEETWKRGFSQVLSERYGYAEREGEKEYENIRDLVNSSNKSSSRTKSGLIDESGEEKKERPIIIFLKDLKSYMTGRGEIKGDNKEIIPMLLKPKTRLSMSDFRRYLEKNRLPNGFDYDMYLLSWYCFTQKEKDKAYEIILEVSKNDLEVAEFFNEIYQKAFD